MTTSRHPYRDPALVDKLEEREHPVPCRLCGAATYRNDATCKRHDGRHQ